MSISSISHAGTNAAQTSFGVTAHNIANLNTPNLRRQQVQHASEPSAGGVTAALFRAAQSGDAIEADVTGELQVKNPFLTNLTVIRTQDR